MKDAVKKVSLLPKEMLAPFILVTSLFALWGFANDITNPLVRAFENIFLIDSTRSSLVQFAFYGGYATMAIPAAIFIRRYSYKSGVLLGLALYALGCLIFIPASILRQFEIFLVAFYIITFGLAFLETTANPYILSMGDPATATRRLNMAQAFNPMGSLLGMLTAKNLILAKLEVLKIDEKISSTLPEGINPSEKTEAVRTALEKIQENTPQDFLAMQIHDLDVVKLPYIVLSLVVLSLFAVFLFKKMPQTSADKHHDLNLLPTFKRLIKNKAYVMGVFAQAFYVGAQIMCWTYIIHYGMQEIGLSAATSQMYNIIAMVIFCSSRFVCTFFLKYVNAGLLLAFFAALAFVLILGVTFLENMGGLYCLVGVSACMSLMFPTIYGIALNGIGEDAKLASSGLIFAIIGGALMPVMQGYIIDFENIMNFSALRLSFLLSGACFVFILAYGILTYKYWSVKR